MTVKDYVYCDFAAGSPARPEVLEVFNQYATQQYSNPGAHHPLAYVAKKHLWVNRFILRQQVSLKF